MSSLATTREAAMDALALNHAARAQLFNPDLDQPSLTGDLLRAFREQPSSEHRQAIDHVKACLAALDAQAETLQEIIATLDRLEQQASVTRHDQRHLRLVPMTGVKGLAQELRPLLRDGRRHGELTDLIRATPRADLLRPSLRNELGVGPHGVLMAHVKRVDSLDRQRVA